MGAGAGASAGTGAGVGTGLRVLVLRARGACPCVHAHVSAHAPTGSSPSRPLVLPSKMSRSTGGVSVMAGPPSKGPAAQGTVRCPEEARVGVAPAKLESGTTGT